LLSVPHAGPLTRTYFNKEVVGLKILGFYSADEFYLKGINESQSSRRQLPRAKRKRKRESQCKRNTLQTKRRSTNDAMRLTRGLPVDALVSARKKIKHGHKQERRKERRGAAASKRAHLSLISMTLPCLSEL
jgi:hypothetical protein